MSTTSHQFSITSTIIFFLFSCTLTFFEAFWYSTKKRERRKNTQKARRLKKKITNTTNKPRANFKHFSFLDNNCSISNPVISQSQGNRCTHCTRNALCFVICLKKKLASVKGDFELSWSSL